ncbi:hypothetical protein ACFRU3_18745 [Streptomyces sp. NPDC056910]
MPQWHDLAGGRAAQEAAEPATGQAVTGKAAAAKEDADTPAA